MRLKIGYQTCSFFLCLRIFFRRLAFLAARHWLPFSLHRSGKKVTDLFTRIDVRKKFVETHLENANEKHLLKVAHMHEAAFDLGNLAAVDVPTGKLQLHREVSLAPTESIPPFHDFDADDILKQLHAAERGMRNSDEVSGRCARLGAM